MFVFTNEMFCVHLSCNALLFLHKRSGPKIKILWHGFGQLIGK